MPRRRRRKVVVDGDEYASFGAEPEHEDEEPEKCSAFEAGDGELPAFVDLRPYMTEVEDQKKSNSCAANAVAGAYEYLAKRAAMESGDEVGDISRLFIYYVGRKQDMCSKGRKDIAPKDSGMSICGAINALQRKGACLEKEWPFDLSQVNEQPPPACWDQAINYKISENMKVPVDLQKMKECLASGYPFVFGAKLTKPFFTATKTKGVVKTPDPEDPQSASHGRHAMLCVGYSDEHQYFIVRNSWGRRWGDKGYCYMPYSYLGEPKLAFQASALAPPPPSASSSPLLSSLCLLLSPLSLRVCSLLSSFLSSRSSLLSPLSFITLANALARHARLGSTRPSNHGVHLESAQCFAIKGLTDCDLTPDSAPSTDLPDPGEADAEDVEPAEIEHQSEDEEEDVEDEINEDAFDPLAEAKRAFAKCDADGSGFLANREVRRALRLNGVRLGRGGRGAVKQALAKFDADGDGQISFDEYLSLCALHP